MGDKEFTDDAAVLESAGYRVKLVQGSARNIKITTAEDLLMAEALIKGE
jgi:2-C-methyl-D-erythritol 4-phosphate cytidylyltransferase